MYEKKSPVEVGDEIEAKIEGVGEKGDKMVKQEGLIIFVPSDKNEGETIKLKITRVSSKVAFGEEIK